MCRTIPKTIKGPYLLVAVAMSGLLAACGGSGWSHGGITDAVPALLARTQRALANIRSPRYIYISDGNFVDEFDRSGKLVTKITAGLNAPQGIFVDGSHNVWVANAVSGADGTILMFPEGATSPARTLQDPGTPGDVAIASDGTAYVANLIDANDYGSILVFPPGQNKFARRLRDPHMAQNHFITLGANGDIFVTTATKRLGQYIGRVDEYVGAKQTGLKTLGIRLGSPGGIKWRDGTIYVCDTTAHTVTQYTEDGKLMGHRLVTGGAWDGIDLSPDGTTVLGADQTYLQGISRAFPLGKIGATYADPQFQAPTGAAFQTDQKGL